ncbi:hypothetical protein HELRODRAFT_194489, partial [Helobdella robusta]|uniref:Uncharacterized protein n=1 Tax=Helobdella robusta TaxID=6412 RepID=T1FW43_HELRO
MCESEKRYQFPMKAFQVQGTENVSVSGMKKHLFDSSEENNDYVANYNSAHKQQKRQLLKQQQQQMIVQQQQFKQQQSKQQTHLDNPNQLTNLKEIAINAQNKPSLHKSSSSPRITDESSKLAKLQFKKHKKNRVYPSEVDGDLPSQPPQNGLSNFDPNLVRRRSEDRGGIVNRVLQRFSRIGKEDGGGGIFSFSQSSSYNLKNRSKSQDRNSIITNSPSVFSPIINSSSADSTVPVLKNFKSLKNETKDVQLSLTRAAYSSTNLHKPDKNKKRFSVPNIFSSKGLSIPANNSTSNFYVESNHDRDDGYVTLQPAQLNSSALQQQPKQQQQTLLQQTQQLELQQNLQQLLQQPQQLQFQKLLDKTTAEQRNLEQAPLKADEKFVENQQNSPETQQKTNQNQQQPFENQRSKEKQLQQQQKPQQLQQTPPQQQPPKPQQTPQQPKPQPQQQTNSLRSLRQKATILKLSPDIETNSSNVAIVSPQIQDPKPTQSNNNNVNNTSNKDATNDNNITKPSTADSTVTATDFVVDVDELQSSSVQGSTIHVTSGTKITINNNSFIINNVNTHNISNNNSNNSNNNSNNNSKDINNNIGDNSINNADVKTTTQPSEVTKIYIRADGSSILNVQQQQQQLQQQH